MKFRLLFYLLIFSLFSCQSENKNCNCLNENDKENQLIQDFRGFIPRHEWRKKAFNIAPFYEIKQETYRVIISNNGTGYLSVYEISKTEQGYFQTNRNYNGINGFDITKIKLLSDTTYKIPDTRMNKILNEIESACLWTWKYDGATRKEKLIEARPIYSMELIDPHKTNCYNLDFNLVVLARNDNDIKKIIELFIQEPVKH